MKQYALIFRMDITTPGAQPTPQQMQQYMQSWHAWTQQIQANGQLAGGNHFSPTVAKVLTKQGSMDGPYVANTQSVAGYLIITAVDLNAALTIAQQCPILQGDNTSVEVREVAGM